MAIPDLASPVSEGDPCGPDLRWDPEFQRVTHALDTAMAGQDEAVVDGERAVTDTVTFADVIDLAGALSRRTKDLRILAIHAHASWADGGLVAFADAMEAIVGVVEAWPDHAEGIHPRADEEDGDLGERAAPMGRLLNRVPELASTIGWGAEVEVSQQVRTAETLEGIFDAWSRRLEPAFDHDLPSCREAWAALRKLLEEIPSSRAETGEQDAAGAGPGPEPLARREENAWDMIERAADLMVTQDHHSPALPILRMLMGWRDLDIIQIAEQMKSSDLSLEQLFDAIQKQNEIEDKDEDDD